MPLCFATNNRNKLAEVRALLPYQYQLSSLEDIGCYDELPETQKTLEGNAYQKAAFVKEDSGNNCFADDTGLEVDALGGAPGVYSARYAGPEKDSQANCSKLLQELKGKESRTAKFRTVICLVRGDSIHYFEGAVSGTITMEPKGEQGFGYDPLFRPDGHQLTFAEMSAQQKNEISHRAQAVKKLIDFLRAEL